MQIINARVAKGCAWIKRDFNDHPIRFSIEILAWVLSIACSITMALTIPNPPFKILYPIFISQCAFFAWSAWSRGSAGMMANYMLLVIIDSAGLFKLLTH